MTGRHAVAAVGYGIRIRRRGLSHPEFMGPWMGRSGLCMALTPLRSASFDVDWSLRKMNIIHPVEDVTCTAAWLKAAELLAKEADATLL